MRPLQTWKGFCGTRNTRREKRKECPQWTEVLGLEAARKQAGVAHWPDLIPPPKGRQARQMHDQTCPVPWFPQLPYRIMIIGLLRQWAKMLPEV